MLKTANKNVDIIIFTARFRIYGNLRIVRAWVQKKHVLGCVMDILKRCSGPTLHKQTETL